MSGCSSGAVPCLRAGIDLVIGHKRRCLEFPCRGFAPAVARYLSCRTAAPASGSLVKRFERPALMSATLLHGRRTGGDDLAIDRPDEGGELARDRGHGDGLRLASPGQRPI